MKLYHHKTDGGAEYLMDTYNEWEHEGKSGKEGVINDDTKYVVRIDGDITKDAELNITEDNKPCVHCNTHTKNTEHVCEPCIKDVAKMVDKELNTK